MKKIIFCFFLTILAVYAKAQTAGDEIEMADIMRSNGKIYVVVAVLAVVFTGIIVYLINLDSKISKIEKRMKN
jgi:CcmD family protein